MRYLLPAVAAAVALAAGTTAAAADSQPQHQRPARVASHVTLHLSKHSVLQGDGIAIHGKVRPSGRHRVKVLVEGTHPTVIHTMTRRNGSFALRWRPARIGDYSVRAYGVHDRHVRGSFSPGRQLTAYHLAGASYYGPGLYGNGVACGGTLMPNTMGVANKTLPCGTKVTLRYHGRTVTVPVIDRGPYVAGREYDLTEAVKDRLGFPGVGDVMADR
ncbi:MAG TPA: septal ring lytic transglycosylase RlpA family protein [Solirubrobacterales bacterium]